MSSGHSLNFYLQASYEHFLLRHVDFSISEIELSRRTTAPTQHRIEGLGVLGELSLHAYEIE